MKFYNNFSLTTSTENCLYPKDRYCNSYKVMRSSQTIWNISRNRKRDSFKNSMLMWHQAVDCLNLVCFIGLGLAYPPWELGIHRKRWISQVCNKSIIRIENGSTLVLQCKLNKRNWFKCRVLESIIRRSVAMIFN